MTEDQYRQLLRNRRRPAPRMLFEDGTGAHLLRHASRSLRARAKASEALEGMLPAEWLRVSRVEALEQGTLTIAVSDREIRELMRRQGPKLLKQLSNRMPGLRRVVVQLS